MRSGRILWLYLVVTGLVACWNWSFDEDLLERDGAVPDGAVDLYTDLPADAGGDVADTGGPDLARDSAVDVLPPDTAKQCSTTCSGTKPVCDTTTGQCRGCEKHSECTGAVSDGELCAADGSCPAAKDITYVDSTDTNCSDTSGTPFCTISAAAKSAALKTYVLVRKNTTGSPYGDFVINGGNHEIYAEPGTVIESSACDSLLFEGGAQVVFSGFRIKGNVKIKDGATHATLVGNTLDGTGKSCIGVNVAGGDPTVELRRNLIINHSSGGVFADGYYTIVNNFIVKNGAGDKPFGGVQLKPPDTAGPLLFLNNTVADNTSKGDKADEAAIRCDIEVPLVTSIIWGNTANLGNAGQFGTKCKPTYCAIDDATMTVPNAENNLNSPPNFKGTGADAEPWHLKAPSPCDAAGDPNNADTPAVDYDKDPRDPGAPDIGADEI